jgi:hypothetical protein
MQNCFITKTIHNFAFFIGMLGIRRRVVSFLCRIVLYRVFSCVVKGNRGRWIDGTRGALASTFYVWCMVILRVTAAVCKRTCI